MQGWKLKLAVLAVIWLGSESALCRGTHRDAISVGVGALQSKEGFNYGLVFTGPALGVDYRHTADYGNVAVSYAADLRPGVLFSRGMTAYDITCMPVRVEVLFRLSCAFRIGAAVAGTYHWQMYPDLQNAHLFAEGEIGLNLVLKYSARVRGCRIDLQAENSLVGFVSHTSHNDPYFYSLDAADFLVEPWKNLHFGSFDRYNHTSATLLFSSVRHPKHRFGIGFDFLYITGSGTFKALNYQLKWQKNF